NQADSGIANLADEVDTLIVIPNQNLFRLANEKTTFTEAFAMADDVLYQGVKGVTDLMVRPGLINLDFADVRAVMDEMGKAMMGTGEASGDDRAVQAAEKAIANPLLDEISLRGAKGVLINITGGYDLTLFELDEAANRIREEVDPEANIIVGSTLDPSMEGQMRVSVVATGIDAAPAQAEVPVARRRLAEPLHQPHAAPQAQPAAAQPPVQDMTYQQQPARAEERGLFDQPAEPAAPAARFEGEGDLPPPAYRPQPAAPQAQRDLYADDDAGAFVAPRPRAAGAPAPETMARLQAAAAKVPSAQQPRAAAQPMSATRPAGQPLGGIGAARGAEKPRFGINSLINRMTGHADQAQPDRPLDRPAPVARNQSLAAAYDDEPEADPEQDRIEIPAFLRRQAN
ncbi:cell division protein FtsZ, partial [Candidatus Falkowbacteria bacterium]|nr:cell division protein FtsZ [Candidatus Falkowbacteria bacterium]